MGRFTILALSFAFLLLVAGNAPGQRRFSPHESTSGSVDGSELSITYGRPYMRGRTIMGGLVPYGIVWCTGADQATTITTSRSLRIGPLTVPAGQYTLWTLPSPDAWQLIVNKQTGQWHTQYHEDRDLGRVAMTKKVLAEPVEQLTIGIRKNPSGAGGLLVIAWETTEVSVAFTVLQ